MENIQTLICRKQELQAIFVKKHSSPTCFCVRLLVFMLTDNMDQQQRLALIRELETLIHVGRHPNIVSLVGACTFEGRVVQHAALNVVYNGKLTN